eukprot:m.1083693 g.1083693  ORF g.1083693 m.1083693 type:complete len:301 (+) comp24270_c0_seq1:2772-3674(+)
MNRTRADTLHHRHLHRTRTRGSYLYHRTPLHDRLAERGAVFAPAGAIERPDWFGAPLVGSWSGEQSWHVHTSAECKAARETVALFDQSSLSKLRVEGPGAAAALQHVCSANVVRGPDRSIYTLMLNDAGGIETECTVSQLSEEMGGGFLVMSGSGVRVKDAHWLRKQIARFGFDARVHDVTEDTAVLGLYGPKAQELLNTVLGNERINTKMGVWSTVTIGGVSTVRVSRSVYTGEMGWELHIPAAGVPGGPVVGHYIFVVHVIEVSFCIPDLSPKVLSANGPYAESMERRQGVSVQSDLE